MEHVFIALYVFAAYIELCTYGKALLLYMQYMCLQHVAYIELCTYGICLYCFICVCSIYRAMYIWKVFIVLYICVFAVYIELCTYGICLYCFICVCCIYRDMYIWKGFIVLYAIYVFALYANLCACSLLHI
jgi:hypothetical protein